MNLVIFKNNFWGDISVLGWGGRVGEASLGLPLIVSFWKSMVELVKFIYGGPFWFVLNTLIEWHIIKSECPFDFTVDWYSCTINKKEWLAVLLIIRICPWEGPRIVETNFQEARYPYSARSLLVELKCKFLAKNWLFFGPKMPKKWFLFSAPPLMWSFIRKTWYNIGASL